jgi:acetylornithine deacetylase/succinyl-diaminopimelate desuccinylase-like protein
VGSWRSEFTVHGPAKDLHSGRHGGGVANPLHAAAALVASLHDADGRIAIDGFYENVDPIEPAADAALAKLSFDEAAYLKAVGAPAAFGEPGFGTLARQWHRPTIEVNGLYGGYQGPGSKTVLPARRTSRSPAASYRARNLRKVAARVRRHLERHCPAGVTLTIDIDEGHGAEPYRVPQIIATSGRPPRHSLKSSARLPISSAWAGACR